MEKLIKDLRDKVSLNQQGISEFEKIGNVEGINFLKLCIINYELQISELESKIAHSSERNHII